MKDEKPGLFDSPRNVKILLGGFYICCIALLVLDFVIHRHIIHRWESLWGFYPLYGFVGCSILVFVATWMRSFLMRDEDYYEKDQHSDNQQKQLATQKGANDVDD